jgi:hypothetical protein
MLVIASLVMSLNVTPPPPGICDVLSWTKPDAATGKGTFIPGGPVSNGAGSSGNNTGAKFSFPAADVTCFVVGVFAAAHGMLVSVNCADC